MGNDDALVAKTPGEKEGALSHISSLPTPLLSANEFYMFLGVGTAERKFLENSNHVKYRYSQVFIPKRRGGKRSLLVPERRLKFLQRKVLTLLEKLYSARTPVHGFVKQRSPITNANQHQKRPYLLNIDLKNYFGTISRRRLVGLLISLGLDEEVAEAVCTICVTRNQLPQGAPTSPILANMITFRLDRNLISFAKKHRLRYTRYADDISLSSYTLPIALFEGTPPLSGKTNIEQISISLRSLINSNGFEINPEKIWFSGPKSRKEVTGLIVNDFTNVKRTFVRNIRAALYKVEKLGIIAAENDYQKRYNNNDSVQNVIRGRIEWIAQIRGRSFTTYRSLATRYNRLFPSSPLPIEPVFSERADLAVWVVECSSRDDCFQGTAFFLKEFGLVTAEHIFRDLEHIEEAYIFRPNNPNEKFNVNPSKRRCQNRDLLLLDHDIPETSYLCLDMASVSQNTKEEIHALGFPDYGPGESLSFIPGKVVSTLTKSSVKLLSLSAILPSGISGGPIINDRNQVVGVAIKGGAEENKQLAVDISELKAIVAETQD